MSVIYLRLFSRLLYPNFTLYMNNLCKTIPGRIYYHKKSRTFYEDGREAPVISTLVDF
jgi:hypothetical protein